MIVDAASFESSQTLKTDICILGGGVSGIVLARELAPFFGEISLIEAGDTSFSIENQALYEPEILPELYPDPTYSRLRMLGGSSNHWENGTEPFDPIDFEKRDWIDNSGWPIGYSEVSKFYPDAEKYCGVGGEGYDAKTWSETLQMDDLFASTDNIESGIGKDSVPPTRFFEEYQKDLSASKNITIYKNANVSDIDFEPVSSKVTSIVFSSHNLIKHRISANVFIMCFGGIENARMLLEFNLRNDNKLGNENDNVGRYFMDHPTIRAAHLYPFERDMFAFYQGFRQTSQYILGTLKLTPAALRENKTVNMRMALKPGSNIDLSHGISSLHTFNDDLIPDHFGTHLTNVLKDLDLIVDKYSRKKFDTPLFDESDEFHSFQILAMMEQTPNRNNRIRLGSQTDKFENHKIIIDHEVSESDREMAWKSLNTLANEVGTISIGRVRLLREQEDRIWNSQLGFAHHHMGTTRMSDSARTGVVDSDQKVFGTDNFYVSGSSVFTTGSHVRPTLTIVALTLRLVEHLKRRYQ